jgi:hypothetical protein
LRGERSKRIIWFENSSLSRWQSMLKLRNGFQVEIKSRALIEHSIYKDEIPDDSFVKTS